eukprot:jgi/Astpho2/1763/fgenesh1_pg.00032_%23_85_t
MAAAWRTTSSSLDAETQLCGASDAPMPQHYYEEPNPDRALAMLEGEMATITLGCGEAADRNSPGVDKLRRLLEHECEGQEDLNAKRDLDPAEYARARLSNVADTWMGTLDPGTGPAAGPAWGVNMLPPGMEITDEHMLEVIRRQQLR